VAGQEENLLGELAAAPADAAAPTAAPPAVGLPPVVVQEDTPAAAFGAPAAPPAVGLPPVVVQEDTPAAAFGAPAAPPGAVATHDPQGTLVSSRDEADELRRRIANPGIPEPEVEMDLEEIGELADSTDGNRAPAPLSLAPPISPGTAPPSPAPVVAPPPSAAPAAASSPTEIEVPVDVEVPPGTTRLRLNLRLILNLKRR
jgi:hypothetical protein